MSFGAADACRAAIQCRDEGCTGVRPQDSVALISSRPIGCSTSPERLAAGLHAEELCMVDDHGAREWQSAPWQTVLAAGDPATPTVVYCHGNRIAWSETKRRGLYAYQHLVRSADDRPIRFVIWSWRADQIPGQLRDYRTKAARTGPVGKQFAWVLNQLPADRPLGIMAYSYGARVASGALEEIGSGRLAGPLRRVRAFYMAAAFDSHWLGRGQCHGAAMEATEKLLLTTNRKDPAMRFYRLLAKNASPQAMGYAGPTCLDRERSPRVRLVNVTSLVSKSHDLCDYVKSPGLMSKAWRMLTYADGDRAMVAKQTSSKPSTKLANSSASGRR